MNVSYKDQLKNEHRTLNVQHRIMNSVNLKKTEQHAAQAPALHERIFPSKFDSAESFAPKGTTEGLVAGCGSLVLKSIKRSVINIDGFVKSLKSSFSVIPAKAGIQ